MSSILSFVVVAILLAIGASVAITAAAQPATDDGPSQRDPWRDRLQPILHWLRRSAHDARRWAAAGVASWRSDRSERRARKAEERRQDAEPPMPLERSDPGPAETPPATTLIVAPPPVDGVVTTALRVTADPAATQTAGDVVERVSPSMFTRLRSALGLMVLIAVLGLALAAILGAAAAAVGAALDSFVN